jgi:DNA-binding CsgD family transcriptional regulator
LSGAVVTGGAQERCRGEVVPSICVFDVNETLLDIEFIAPLFQRLFGDGKLLREWFGHLILYSNVITLSGLYTPFFTLGQGVLRMLGSIHNVTIHDADIQELRERMLTMPAMSVRAMKGGAVDFLIKPFRDQDMLDAVMTGLERDRKRRAAERQLADLRSHLETLSPRELEVMALVTAGLMNKQIAGELGIQEITIKGHRGRVMRKMGARSLAELVKIAAALGVNRRCLRRDLQFQEMHFCQHCILISPTSGRFDGA